jgi:D-alanyl-D-alanine carboxypeptidase
MECYFLHGNDAAYTVGLHIGGTVENFGKMMTEKAQKIGAINTNFANPHGLDDEKHYSTAKDMALITRYAIRNKYINEAIGTETATIDFGSFSKTLRNTNALLRTYDKADGGKTGFTNGANRCLIETASDAGDRYIAVLLGADTTEKRFGETKTILEESFKRYKSMDISKYLNFYINIPVQKGNVDSYEIQISDSKKYPLTQEEYDSIYVKQDIIQNIVPPMKAGTKLGNISLYVDDEQIYTKDIYLEYDIYKKTIFDYMNKGLSDIFAERSVI